MGIKGLLLLMESICVDTNISELRGSVAVIDGNSWIHKACYGCADVLYAKEDTDQFVNYCLNRAQMLIKVGIKPIIVFDGQKLLAKELTSINRQINRHNIRQRIELLLSEGNESKARELMRGCVEVTSDMTLKVIRALRDRSIDYLVSPFEADSQMAYLVRNGFADFVITEDSDLLVFNCRFCLFKMDSNGNARLIDMSLMNNCLGSNFNEDKFRHMCILSGCDYLQNLRGIGLQKAKKFFKMTANNDLRKVLYKVPNYLKMAKKVKVTEEYVENFIKADNTFKYQLVFCPKDRKLIPLTKYEPNIKTEDLSYAGTHFSDQLSPEFPYHYAIGNVDINRLEIVDDYDFEPKQDSIWHKDWINYKNKNYSNKKLVQKFISSINRSNQLIDRKTIVSNESINSDNSRKRLKVDENRFVTNTELLSEYSSETKTMATSGSSVKSVSIEKRDIYSRNIFKVVNEKSDETAIIQSRFFSDLRKNKSSIDESINGQKHSNKILEQSSQSQYSVNSSGNTTTDSGFGDISFISETDRSEISETSDEELVITEVIEGNNNFTNIRPSNKSKRLLPLDINVCQRQTVSRYFPN